MRSVYIHIPFCKSICSYCDFCKFLLNKNFINSYLKALKEEIKEKYQFEVLKTLYIGGGTPSSLKKEELEKLFKIIKIFNLDKNYEFTFEVNVNDLTEDLLLFLKENKVNRLSIGIQTFNKKYLKLLNRKNNDVINKINLAKKYFDNINVDLMYGFFNQTLKELQEDLDLFLKLELNHISTYALILENNTKLKIDNYQELDDNTQRNMYDKIRKILKNNGYNHYELSNFAKKGYESRHNLNYWNNKEYYGFGLGASSYVNGKRITNTRSLNKYIKHDYSFEEEIITKKIDMENEMILGLRTTKGVSKQKFKQKFGKEIHEVFPTNNLKENKNYYYIPKNKLFIENSILVDFILD